jgi:hypothetical protein
VCLVPNFSNFLDGDSDMTRFVKATVFASLCIALTFSSNALAQKGGTGGGGGTATPPPPNRTAAPLTFGGGLTTLTVGSDQPAFVMLQANSDGRDAPIITKNSGPDGLILYNTTPADHPHGINGYTLSYYVWTPGRGDIGSSPQASFTATTQSGASRTIIVNLGPVQDVPPGVISGLTASLAGDHIEAHWNSSATGAPLTYTVTACYHSLLLGTTLPYLFCDRVGTTNDLQLLDIPSGPAQNAGQPGVPVTYYGLFVNASSAIDSHLAGQATTNVQ